MSSVSSDPVDAESDNEDRLPPLRDESDYESSDDPEEAAERAKIEASENLCEFCINLYLDQIPLSAMSLCILMHWAVSAGVQGFVKRLAMKPGKQTGKYSRKVKRVLQFDMHDKRLCKLSVPTYKKYSLSRSVHDIWVLPPHEALHEEVVHEDAAGRSIASRVRDSIVGQEWAPVYNEHPIVKAHPGRTVIPYALYLDGAPFTKTDGFLAFLVYNLVTGTRHLSVLLRKSEMCACGCRGWCTIFIVFWYLNYCFRALANGTFPLRRCDKAPWHPVFDDDRCSWAGGILALLGALCQIKCDWAELAGPLAFPSRSSRYRPCLFCNCDRESMHHQGEHLTLDDSPHEDNTIETYDRDCKRCEVWAVVPDSHTLEQTQCRIAYDKTKKGGLGLCMPVEFDGVVPSLLKGDSVEPHPGMIDHANIWKLVLFQTHVSFWRRSFEASTMHRNPLYDDNIGVHSQVKSIDTLHTLSLGVYQRFAMFLGAPP